MRPRSRKLKRAGAVLAAKLAMVELAGGGGYRYPSASLQGPGRNPWNMEHWSGGSSSGSGLRGRRRAGAVRDRLGDLGLDRHAVRVLRRHRPASDVRARQPARRDGALVDARQDRPDGAQRRGLRPGARGDRRAGRRRPDLVGQTLQAARRARRDLGGEARPRGVRAGGHRRSRRPPEAKPRSNMASPSSAASRRSSCAPRCR